MSRTVSSKRYFFILMTVPDVRVCVVAPVTLCVLFLQADRKKKTQKTSICTTACALSNDKEQHTSAAGGLMRNGK